MQVTAKTPILKTKVHANMKVFQDILGTHNLSNFFIIEVSKLFKNLN
jgi:hypothetical protein